MIELVEITDAPSVGSTGSTTEWVGGVDGLDHRGGLDPRERGVASTGPATGGGRVGVVPPSYPGPPSHPEAPPSHPEAPPSLPERAGGGVLVLAGTPIGNRADASPRLVAELARADVVAAEDTRRLRRLAGELGVELTGQVVSFYDAVERDRLPQLLAALREGRRVVLVTDAGMPSVSDPGYRLVAACADAGLAVTVVPGPSAVLAALAVSGLPVDRFTFEGFLPRKAGERSRLLAALASDPRTLVFFEAPHRLAETLGAMAEAFGADRPAAVCRELTKTHEQVRRGPLGELAVWAAGGVKGEVTVVVQGSATAGGHAPVPDDPRKAAIAAVATAYGIDKRAAYDAIVAARRAPGSAGPAPSGR